MFSYSSTWQHLGIYTFDFKYLEELWAEVCEISHKLKDTTRLTPRLETHRGPRHLPRWIVTGLSSPPLHAGLQVGSIYQILILAVTRSTLLIFLLVTHWIPNRSVWSAQHEMKTSILTYNGDTSWHSIPSPKLLSLLLNNSFQRLKVFDWCRYRMIPRRLCELHEDPPDENAWRIDKHMKILWPIRRLYHRSLWQHYL